MEGLYTKPFAIMKTSGNNNVTYQFILIRLFQYTSWPAGVLARIQKKAWELTSNNAIKLWLPPHPLDTNDRLECSHNTTWTLPHM